VQVENNGSLPSIYKLFTLSAIYGLTLPELLAYYVDTEAAGRLHGSMQLASTHLCSVEGTNQNQAASLPRCSTGGAAADNTTLIAGSLHAQSDMPLATTLRLDGHKRRYAFIGRSDYTMYPLIRPGSFVEIDECEKVAPPAVYRTEYDRPIYFLELRTGYVCSWCQMSKDRILSIPHPLSPCRARSFVFPSEAEVIGRVTSILMRLTEVSQPQKVGNGVPVAQAHGDSAKV
jgi:hypothetical protein